MKFIFPETRSQVRGMRIGHLIESDGPGGAERVLVHLARSLTDLDTYNVVFLPLNGEGWIKEELAGSGVRIEYFDLEKPLSWRCVTELAEAFKRHQLNVTHGHEFTMSVYGAWASRLAGIGNLFTMHGSQYYAQKMTRRLAMRSAVAMSSSVVAVSETVRAQLSKDLWVRRSQVQHIPNGVPFREGHSGLRRELGLNWDTPLLITVGNLYPVKGQRYLLDAFAEVRKQHPDVHLAIAGRGELDAPLRARAEELGVGDAFHLLGLRSDIPDILSEGDIFVLPSLSEGLPLAILEAMFAGLPIIASAVGEIPTVLEDGKSGMLVPPGETDALTDAIRALLKNPGQAVVYGDRAKSRATQDYCVDGMVAKYATLYRKAGKGKVGQPEMPNPALVDEEALPQPHRATGSD